jgi:hypothetical protein
MRKIYLLIAIFVAAIGLVWFYPPNSLRNVPTVKDNEVKEAGTFEECVEEGNPVEESYPPVCRTADGKLITQNIGNELILKDKIRLASPRPMQKITSPLTIKGEARGGWFFEGQFGAKVLNDAGVVIGQGVMTATTGWMTEEFVPFEGEIDFKMPEEMRGRLLLEKSNPSDLPENSEVLIVPISFR